MKLKLLPLFLLAFSSIALAQSISITPRKIVYKRPKPISEYKKSFTVTRPVVRAANIALSKKIEAAISYEKNLEFSLRDELRDYQWLEEAYYEVGYNKNDILSVKLFLSGSGAYPSVSSKTVVVDTKTGNQLKAADVFTNLEGLAAANKKLQQAEIKKAREDYKKDPDAADFDGAEYFDNADFKPENLEGFAIGETGVTFLYDYGFPHVALALQPDGEYLFTWAQLKPFIKRGGLLEKFVR